MRSAVIILCAGKSSRMGQDKAMLKIGSEPAVKKLVNKYSLTVDEIVVVTGDNHCNIKSALCDLSCRIIENTQREKGMFSSVKTGVQALELPCCAFIQPVDSPFVSIDSICKIRDYETDKQVVIPSFISTKKRSGHPVLLKEKALKAVRDSDHEDNLKNVIRNLDSTAYIVLNDKHILDNLNTPEDLESLVKK